MRQQPAKFIGFFNLIEAMKEPGCPVCNRLTTESHQAIDSFLYESVKEHLSKLKEAYGRQL